MDILKSLRKIAGFLQSNNYSYMIIGGIATSYYGYVRQTFDIDIKIHLDLEKDLTSFINNISTVCQIRTQNPVHFIDETSVLPISIDEVDIDIIFARLPFEINAIKRAVSIKFENIEFQICSLEDLIIQKAISTRNKDWLDIENLIRININNIDWNYLNPFLKELTEWLAFPIIDRIEDLKKNYE